MSASGQKVMNVIGIENAEGSAMTAILAAVKTAWEQTGGPLSQHVTGTKMVGYHGVDLTSASGAVGFLGSTEQGLLVHAPATLAACAIIKLSSGTRSRSQQGRLYHGPLSEDQIATDGRTISPQSLANLNTAYDKFKTSLQGQNHPWSVLSRKNSTYQEITTLSCAGVIGTQRRRLR